MPERSARTDLPDMAFAPFRQITLARAAEHDLTVARDDAYGLRIDTYYGRLEFAPLGKGTRAEIHAPHADYVQVLKDSVVDQIGVKFPHIVQSIRWDDTAGKTELPANIWPMTVVSVKRMECGFLRVTLRGDVSRFSDEAIHFRVGIAPEGRIAQWPTVGANGSTQWPKGEDKLHLPVYTARHVDHDAGTLCFDVFSHDGGRASRWAQTVVAESEVLVTSPGGGGCRLNGEIYGFTDETGFPAVARILNANSDLTGRFLLYPSRASAMTYPIPDHAGVEVEFAEPGSGALIAEAAQIAIRHDAPPFLWFAAERSQAAIVRAEWRKKGHNLKQAYISAFWQKCEQ
ncbi:MAG TPA: siderophore-interacting protein [Roseovarius sp.]